MQRRATGVATTVRHAGSGARAASCPVEKGLKAQNREHTYYGVVSGIAYYFLGNHFLVAALLGRPSRTGDSCSHGHCAGTVVLRFSRFVRVPHRRPLTAAARCHSAAATASAVLWSCSAATNPCKLSQRETCCKLAEAVIGDHTACRMSVLAVAEHVACSFCCLVMRRCARSPNKINNSKWG